MLLPRALRIALYLLVADGVAALHVADFIDARGVVAIGILAAVSWWSGRLHEGGIVRRGVDRVVVPIAAVASLVDLFYVAETVLDALVRLLLFLVVYKLFTLRSVRDTRTVSFLAFFMLVAAASSAFGVGFLFVFLAFVVLATWVTLLQHALLEAGSGPEPRAAGAELAASCGHPLFRLALGAAGTVIVITAALFFVLPRIGLAALPLRARLGQMVTGFSERVELGAYGPIASDPTVVMRVQIPEGAPDPERLRNLRWRGIALDEFDGRAWSVRHPHQTRLFRTLGSGGLQVGLLRGTGAILQQEFYLEPLGTDVVFAAPRLLRLGLQAEAVNLDDMGSVSVPPPTARLHYTAESQLEEPPAPRASVRRPAPPLDSWTRARYLDLPPLPARIPTLAREVAAGSEDPYETALRLTWFLSREFRYTLNPERLTALGPLEEFLFVRRSGHCQYFAAALAVMLRTLDVPARVVNGFQRGEWNPYGRYFIVRLRDAHSWVEAYVGQAGWVTLDPSPRAEVEAEAWAPPGTTFLYLDALRLQWHRYVINWSLRDQVGAARAFRRHAATWGPWLQSLRGGGDRSRAVGVAVGLLAIGLGLCYWWRERPGKAGGTGARLPRFYARALRAAGRRGFRPAAGETAREFCARVAGLGPAWADAFGRLTLAYERCRFGAARLTARELVALDACAATLRAARKGTT